VFLEELQSYSKVLGITPFGIINDKEKHVKVYLDDKMKEADIVNFHPNVNTSTVSLSFADFIKFMEWSQNTYEFIDLPI